MYSLKSSLHRLLRWSEKYTKTDMVYLTRGGFWLLASQITATLASLGLAVEFAHLFPREAYGTYKYLLVILGILTLACLRGFDTLLIQASARGNDGTVLRALYTKMRWGILGSIGSMVLGTYYYLHANQNIAIALFLSALFIPIMDPLGVYSSILNGKKDFRLLSLLDSASQLFAAGILGIALLYSKSSITIFFLYCLSWTIVRFISLRVALKKYPPNKKIEPNWKSYGMHSSLIGSMAVALASIDGFAIFHYLGASQLAVYSFAMAPVLQLRGLSGVLTTLATPKFATQEGFSIHSPLVRRSLALSLVGLGIAALYAIAAPLIFAVLFPQYADAVPFSQVFSITIALSLGASLLSGVLNSRTTLIPKKMLYLWNIPSIVLGFGSILLIQVIGIWGAIAAQILSSLASAIIGWFLWLHVRHRAFAATPVHSV